MSLINNIKWMPIDVPKFPYPDFNINQDHSWAFWKFGSMTEKVGDSFVERKLDPNLLQQYPLLENWFKHFPYKSIRNVKFNIQVADVKVHKDFNRIHDDYSLFLNNRDNEPCGYRVLLKGSRNRGMFLADGEQKQYINMPEETDVYVLGQTNIYHGVDYEPGRTTIFMHFEIDRDRHVDLLNRSYAKYKHYAII